APERLLPAGTQLYLRWDGYAAHREAYDRSAFGRLLAGDAGRSLRLLTGHLEQLAESELLGEPLLDGAPPEELEKLRSDWRAARRLPHLLAERGLIVAAEVRWPWLSPNLLGTLGRLMGDEPEAELLPRPFVTLIIPGAGSDPEPALAALRLLARAYDVEPHAAEVAGRKLTLVGPERERIAGWVEGKHLVVATGAPTPAQLVRRVADAGAGITAVPAFRRLQEFKEFRPVARGYFRADSLTRTLRPVTQPFAPEVWATLDELGLTRLRQVSFWQGFEGEATRTVVELEPMGGRRGLGKVLKREPIKLADLPPLPQDVSRWAAARIDLNEAYDVLLTLSLLGETGRGEEAGASPRERREQEIDQSLGFKVREDLLAALGDRVVTYQSPGEAVSNFGQAVAVSVRDEAALRRGFGRLAGLAVLLSGALGPAQVTDYHGVPVHQFPAGFLTPSYAVCDGWLVAAFYPQPVYGFILRAKGEIPAWKPDARTAATLARLPEDTVALQYTDPRVSARLMISYGPLALSAIQDAALGDPRGRPLDLVGLIPHADSFCGPLFPNVTAVRDDGEVWRWDSRDSFSLPPEIIPPEMAYFIGLFN
ncbi:MAG TPA: hypothetical protein VIL46_00075, partial [Gemmataceae bacterium]